MLKNILIIFTILSMTSCASIVSKSLYPVSINSTPSGAKFKVTNKHGMVMQSGKTPSVVYLKAGNGYFKKARYGVEFNKKGYGATTSTIRASLDNWYWGNLLLGGAIGMLLVDPVTGAMYKLPAVSTASLDDA